MPNIYHRLRVSVSDKFRVAVVNSFRSTHSLWQKEKPFGWKRADLAISKEDSIFNKNTNELSFSVHNIGSLPAKDFTVEIKKIKQLDAPDDLKPKVI